MTIAHEMRFTLKAGTSIITGIALAGLLLGCNQGGLAIVDPEPEGVRDIAMPVNFAGKPPPPIDNAGKQKDSPRPAPPPPVPPDDEVVAVTEPQPITGPECEFSYASKDDDGVFGPIQADIAEHLQPYCGKLSAIFLSGLDYSIFDKAAVFTMEESSTWDLLSSVETQFDLNKNKLAAAWPFFSDDELEMIFMLNVVGRLWHFGNFLHPETGGCVHVNEEILPENGDYIWGTATDGTPIYYQRYMSINAQLRSNIGCCIDHAYFLELLLSAAGFEAHRIDSPSHWLVEAVIGDQRYTLDASFGIMIRKSIGELGHGDQREAFVFSFPYMESQQQAIYPRMVRWTMSLGFDYPVTDQFISLKDGGEIEQ